MQYQEFESTLSNYFGIGEEDLEAFRAELKYLRVAHSVPFVPVIGSGRRHEYQFRDLWDACLALAICRLGVKPNVAAMIVNRANEINIIKEVEDTSYVVMNIWFDLDGELKVDIGTSWPDFNVISIAISHMHMRLSARGL